MEKKFVPYKLALKLKELGFDELCFGYYTHNEKLCRYDSTSTNVEFTPCIHKNIYNSYCLAPLWQDAFDWFREKYNLDSWVYKYYDDEVEKELYRFNLRLGDFHSSFYNNYQEARQACLEMLIEMVNRKHNVKELLLKAYSEGKTIQSNHNGEWHDFVPHNQLDKPNLDYGSIDNWRIKP